MLIRRHTKAASWSDDETHGDVVRFGRNSGDDLFIRSDPTLDAINAVHVREEPVIKPFAPTQPPAAGVESYSRYEDKVQLVQWQNRGTGGRLENAEGAR